MYCLYPHFTLMYLLETRSLEADHVAALVWGGSAGSFEVSDRKKPPKLSHNKLLKLARHHLPIIASQRHWRVCFCPQRTSEQLSSVREAEGERRSPNARERESGARLVCRAQPVTQQLSDLSCHICLLPHDASAPINSIPQECLVPCIFTAHTQTQTQYAVIFSTASAAVNRCGNVMNHFQIRLWHPDLH